MILRRLPHHPSAPAQPLADRHSTVGELAPRPDSTPNTDSHPDHVWGVKTEPRPLSERAAKHPTSKAQRAIYRLKGFSLRTRLACLTALTVMVSIAVVTGVAYTTVSRSLEQQLDNNLYTEAQSIIDTSAAATTENPPPGEAQSPLAFAEASNDVGVLIIPADQTGPQTPAKRLAKVLPDPTIGVVEGTEPRAYTTAGRYRYFAIHAPDNRVIVVRQDITFTHQTLDALALILLLVTVTGFLGAIVTGIAVASSALQPIARLRRATDRVTHTGQLRQIPVYNRDELGALTKSFNNMMEALQEAQTKQKNLVADASHELKTPLTSLRTNVELLMLASKSESATISKQDREDIERDVIAQIEEMSTLIGDLVDLAREEEADKELTNVDLDRVIRDGIERVQRRRPDVTFEAQLIDWDMRGDHFGLSRALLNILDNAAKWSPEGATVRVGMTALGRESRYFTGVDAVLISVADSGPGIPVEDRPKVFDRFYRSISSRSMPGSGLGLAIVQQVIDRHSGVVFVEESDDGGALMNIVLPGDAVR